MKSLRPRDIPRRFEYFKKMKNLIKKNPELFNEIIMSDEAHFTLSGSMNKQNM